VAEKRFGLAGRGAVHTRTGRSFFEPALTDELLLRLRSVVTEAGLFEELDTSWMLLDAELLPWSAKAGDLLRNQYAAVGAAARFSLPAATAALESAVAAGLDVTDLLERTKRRTVNAELFSAAYRRYCWPTDGLDGIKVAPFQVLATEGATYQDSPHAWHLGIADRLVTAGSDVFTATRRLYVDQDSWAEGIAWWEELTGAGGEGMVVKPAANLVRTDKGLAQPGLKVRGQEYLRIIYGPDYTEPANFDRLRNRNLGHKRSLALREYALGLEALERAARGEPLWRIHECVFAVLALESEPVDPRL
jgi:protein phosphatase